eukprot:12932836-Prorocentrum_lima.AAC.1
MSARAPLHEFRHGRERSGTTAVGQVGNAMIFARVGSVLLHYLVGVERVDLADLKQLFVVGA